MNLREYLEAEDNEGASYHNVSVDFDFVPGGECVLRVDRGYGAVLLPCRESGPEDSYAVVIGTGALLGFGRGAIGDVYRFMEKVGDISQISFVDETVSSEHAE